MDLISGKCSSSSCCVKCKYCNQTINKDTIKAPPDFKKWVCGSCSVRHTKAMRCRICTRGDTNDLYFKVTKDSASFKTGRKTMNNLVHAICALSVKGMELIFDGEEIFVRIPEEKIRFWGEKDKICSICFEKGLMAKCGDCETVFHAICAQNRKFAFRNNVFFCENKSSPTRKRKIDKTTSNAAEKRTKIVKTNEIIRQEMNHRKKNPSTKIHSIAVDIATKQNDKENNSIRNFLFNEIHPQNRCQAAFVSTGNDEKLVVKPLKRILKKEKDIFVIEVDLKKVKKLNSFYGEIKHKISQFCGYELNSSKFDSLNLIGNETRKFIIWLKRLKEVNQLKMDGFKMVLLLKNAINSLIIPKLIFSVHELQTDCFAVGMKISLCFILPVITHDFLISNGSERSFDFLKIGHFDISLKFESVERFLDGLDEGNDLSGRFGLKKKMLKDHFLKETLSLNSLVQILESKINLDFEGETE